MSHITGIWLLIITNTLFDGKSHIKNNTFTNFFNQISEIRSNKYNIRDSMLVVTLCITIQKLFWISESWVDFQNNIYTQYTNIIIYTIITVESQSYQ